MPPCLGFAEALCSEAQQGLRSGEPADDPAAVSKPDLAAVGAVDALNAAGKVGEFVVYEDLLLQLLVRHRRPEMEDAGWM